MGCDSCKNKNGAEDLNVYIKGDGTKGAKQDIGFMIFNVLIRTLMFGISLLATPIIMLFVVYLLFKTIMLNKGDINLMPSLLAIGKGMGIGKKKTEDEHPDDYEDLDSNNPDEYELDEKVDTVEL